MKPFIDTHLDKIQGNRSSHVTVPFIFYLISDCFFKILNKIITVSAKLTAWSSHTNLSASPFCLPILIPTVPFPFSLTYVALTQPLKPAQASLLWQLPAPLQMGLMFLFNVPQALSVSLSQIFTRVCRIFFFTNGLLWQNLNYLRSRGAFPCILMFTKQLTVSTHSLSTTGKSCCIFLNLHCPPIPSSS